MSAGVEIVGGNLAIAPTKRPPQALVDEYLAAPEMFERQFGQPVTRRDLVLAGAQRAVESGLSSYLDLDIVSGASRSTIAHIRVDWLGDDEGMLCLHGGAPRPEREHARARYDGWQLLIRAAFADPRISKLATVTRARNRAAQALIASGGFRRVREQATPDGGHVLHYRLVRAWLPPNPKWDGFTFPALTRLRPPPKSATPSANAEPWPCPDGWQPIDADSEATWLAALSGNRAFASYLAGLPADAGSSTQTALQTMRFAARHGTAFYGLCEDGQPIAVIAAQSFPERAGLLLLRGGALVPGEHAPNLSSWIRSLGSPGGRLEHVAAIAPASSPGILGWWLQAGFSPDGTAEVDADGNPAELALSWRGGHSELLSTPPGKP